MSDTSNNAVQWMYESNKYVCVVVLLSKPIVDV